MESDDSRNWIDWIFVVLMSVGVYAGMFRVILPNIHTIDGLVYASAGSIILVIVLLLIAWALDREETEKNVSGVGVLSFLISEVSIFIFQITPSVAVSKIKTSSNFASIPITLRGQYNGTTIILTGNAEFNLSKITSVISTQSELVNITLLVVLILLNMGFFVFSLYLVIKAYESRKNKKNKSKGIKNTSKT